MAHWFFSESVDWPGRLCRVDFCGPTEAVDIPADSGLQTISSTKANGAINMTAQGKKLLLVVVVADLIIVGGILLIVSAFRIRKLA